MLNRFRVYKISKVNDAEISDIGPARIETFWLRVSLLANVFTKSIMAYLLLILRRGLYLNSAKFTTQPKFWPQISGVKTK